MIDLPLGHRQPSPRRRPSAGRGGPPKKAPRGAARDRRGRRLLWLLLVVLATVMLWWLFWPAPARIVVSEPLLTFADQRAGVEGETLGLSVSNAGERTLRLGEPRVDGEAAADFEIAEEDCVGRPLAPGDWCSIRLQYRPTAAGRRVATLSLVARAANSPVAVALEAEAMAPAVGLAPSSIDFGSVGVGGEHSERMLTISNVGSAPLELGRVTFEGPQAAEFDRDRRCPKTTLAPGEACTVQVRFAPAAAGERRAELVIASDDPTGQARLRLSGRGTWSGPPFEPRPERLDLGEQRVGRQSPLVRLELVNRSAAAVDVSMLRIVPDDAPFEVIEDRCGSRVVVSGESCQVVVAARPGAEGELSGTLEVIAPEGSALRVPLTARGVEPRLRVDTAGLDFGSLRAGFESAPKSAVFTNTGSATLSVERVRLLGTGADGFVLKTDCRGATIAPGKRCVLEVAFRPPGAGARSARLELTPSDGLEPLRVALAGVGVVADLAVAPGRLDWGNLQIGRVESDEVVMTNTGSARLEVRGLRISGPADADFRVTNIACRLDDGLAAGESCRLTVSFLPAVEGERQAQLEIQHDAPGSPMRVELLGVGGRPRPVFRASPNDFGFGTVAVGARSDIETLTITNPGSAWLRLRSVTLAGENRGDFQLVPGTCDGLAALAPDGRCTMGLRFLPRAPGRRRAILEIRHDAPGSPAVISLAGVGG